MDKMNITFPDGSLRKFDPGTTAAAIAHSISEGFFRNAVAAKVNGKLVDLSYSITEDSTLEIITKREPEAHDILLHSTAHLMAQAIKILFPEAQIAIGPSIENGFYYDIDLDESINDDTLAKIEQKMKELAKAKFAIHRKELTRKEALGIFSDLNEKYKIELIEEFEDDTIISAYEQGEFVDLCRGPHVLSTGNLKYFKLLSCSGAYWRGDENNKMLQRVYGTAFFDKKDLKKYLHMLEEAKKRDHRKIGKELELFTFDEEVGPGLPLWLPNGTVLIEEIEKYAKETERKDGYVRVRTPHLTKGVLYERSGHLELYGKDMYPPMEMEGFDYYIKPMNCPHHHKIYAASPRSYRDLPLRLAEYGTCYRHEKSGQLLGLFRVRSLQMNDAHIYCTSQQFKAEFLAVCKLYDEYMEVFGIDKFQMRLSLHDPKGLGKKYVNEPDLWIESEKLVREVLQDGEYDFVEIADEAAFYGPKLDVEVWSAIGKEYTLATNQVDFAIPKRFGLTFTNENGQEETPICIHRAPLSTHERFIGFLIEHFAGDFPLWLAPVQVIVLPISEKYLDYAKLIHEKLINLEIRVETDKRSEKIGAKIRQAELKKIPVMLIVGEKEMNSNSVSIRRRHEGDLGTLEINQLISELTDEILKKSRRSSNKKV